MTNNPYHQIIGIGVFFFLLARLIAYFTPNTHTVSYSNSLITIMSGEQSYEVSLNKIKSIEESLSFTNQILQTHCFYVIEFTEDTQVGTSISIKTNRANIFDKHYSFGDKLKAEWIRQPKHL